MIVIQTSDGGEYMSTSYNSLHGTLVNCIDGTVQLPAIEYAKKIWNVEWVDVITDAAPERILSEAKGLEKADHIHDNIEASLCNQIKKRLAIVSHSDCDINTASDWKKIKMLRRAIEHLKSKHTDAEVMGIWINNEGIPCSLGDEMP